jgi:hypothetical protein
LDPPGRIFANSQAPALQVGIREEPEQAGRLVDLDIGNLHGFFLAFLAC